MAVIKSFFQKKVFGSFLCMLTYVTILIYILIKANYWDISLIKDSVWWIFGVGFVMLVDIARTKGKESHFKTLIIDSFKLTLVIEFIVNLHSFSLVVELIFVPVVTFAVAMMSFAQTKEEYKPVEKLFEYILGVLGTGLILYVGYRTVSDFDNFASIMTLRDFSFPIIMTLAFIPFLFLMALYAEYDNVFVRVNAFNTSPEAASVTKKYLLILCNFNLRRLSKVVKGAEILNIQSKNELLDLIRKRQQL